MPTCCSLAELPCDVLTIFFGFLGVTELLLRLSPSCSQIARAVNASGSWRDSTAVPHAPSAVHAWRNIRLRRRCEATSQKYLTVEHVIRRFGPGTVSLALGPADAPDTAIGNIGLYCRALRCLDLSGCAALTDRGLFRLAAAVSDHCFPLEALTLARPRAPGAAASTPRAITDHGLGAVLRASCSYALALAPGHRAHAGRGGGGRVSGGDTDGADDRSSGARACARRCQRGYRGLRTLRLSGGGPGVSARTIHGVARYAPALTELDVSGCMGIGRLDAALCILARACTELRVLNVYGAGGDAGLRWARAATADAGRAAAVRAQNEAAVEVGGETEYQYQGVYGSVLSHTSTEPETAASFAPEGVSPAAVVALGRRCPQLRSLRALVAPATTTAQRAVCCSELRDVCGNLSDLMLDNVAEGART